MHSNQEGKLARRTLLHAGSLTALGFDRDARVAAPSGRPHLFIEGRPVQNQF